MSKPVGYFIFDTINHRPVETLQLGNGTPKIYGTERAAKAARSAVLNRNWKTTPPISNCLEILPIYVEDCRARAA